MEGKRVGIIETKYGKIYIELFKDEAPNTVENFKKLAEKGFYDSLTFHRYEPDFVIQGGDPEGNGRGGPGYTIKAEINSHKHLKGAVAMARKEGDLDSAGSQFYITLEETPFLDGQYTVFGQVVGGMDAVIQLRAGDKMDKVTVKDF
nr:peptidylprolyl isomerase [Phosphitispora fastidiosa]